MEKKVELDWNKQCEKNIDEMVDKMFPETPVEKWTKRLTAIGLIAFAFGCLVTPVLFGIAAIIWAANR